jgi:hypothetical protein
LEKSTFNPGPPPRKQSLWYKAEGKGLTALLQGIDAAGKPISLDPSNFDINFDDKDHSTTRLNYDSSAWTRIEIRMLRRRSFERRLCVATVSALDSLSSAPT